MSQTRTPKAQLDSTLVDTTTIQSLSNKTLVSAVVATASAGFAIVDNNGVLSSEILTISKEFFLSTGSNTTFPLDSGAGFSYTINRVKGAQCSNGNITASIQIQGSAVTNMNSISITTNSSAADTIASGANTVSTGNRVTVVFTSNSAASNIEFTLVATRTS